MMTDIANYLDFVLLLFLAFGIAFEMPVAVVLLVATGLVKIEMLTRNRGYVILGIFIIAAFLTPPDAVSQSFMAVPMYLLYELGIVFARIDRRQSARARRMPPRAENARAGDRARAGAAHPRALVDAVLHRDVGAFHVLRHARPARAVPGRRGHNGGYGLDDKTATAIYGLYTAAVFMAALPGGWIADRLLGAQRAVLSAAR